MKKKIYLTHTSIYIHEPLRALSVRKENDTLENPVIGDGRVSQKGHVTCVRRELTRAEERAVCGNFARMIKERRIRLTVDQQPSVARSMSQALLDPTFSLDVGDGLLFDEGCHGGDGKSMTGIKGIEGTGESEIRNGAKDQVQPIDQARIMQPSEDTEMMSERACPKKMSGATGDSNEEGFSQEDLGDYDLVGICMAFARDNLDERRMQRLRVGLFGLLNRNLRANSKLVIRTK